MDRRITCAGVLAMMAMGGFAIGQTASDRSSSAAGLGSSSGQTSGQPGQAGQYGQAGQQQQGAMDMDKLFIKHAAADNMCEIQLSQMAQQKAQSQEVKQFAQQMVQDHTKAQAELRDLAKKNGVQVSMSLPPDKQEIVQAFQQLQGADFDKNYISAMKADHAKAVSKYQDVSQMAKNQDLKTWAAGKVSDLEKHAQMVASLATQQGLAAGSSSSSSDQAQQAGSTIQPGSSNQQQGTTNRPGSADRSGTSGGTSGSSNQSTSGGTPGSSR